MIENIHQPQTNHVSFALILIEVEPQHLIRELSDPRRLQPFQYAKFIHSSTSYRTKMNLEYSYYVICVPTKYTFCYDMKYSTSSSPASGSLRIRWYFRTSVGVGAGVPFSHDRTRGRLGSSYKLKLHTFINSSRSMGASPAGTSRTKPCSYLLQLSFGKISE